jgi:Rne/Rng family ribonuclease
VRGLTPPPGGYIVRTNAEGKGEEEFAADIELLGRLWGQVQARFVRAAAPAALHEEMDLAFRVVRDLFSPEVEEFIVDRREVFDRCVEYARTLVPALVERVRLYEGVVPLFESLGLEKDIE